MNLRQYFDGLDRPQSAAKRAEMARRHGVTRYAVRAWIEGKRQHPPELAAVEITESVTEGHVTRYDLRPEIHGHAA